MNETNVTIPLFNNNTGGAGSSFFETCFDMENLTFINPIIGNVSRMQYMYCGQWRNNTGTFVMSILLGLWAILCSGINIILYLIHRYKRNKQTYTNWITLWFNITNCFLYVVLSQVGWPSSGFFIAAVHNSIEFMHCLVLFKKYFRCLFPKPIIYNIVKDISMMMVVCMCLPHLIIVDFKVNSMVKAAGGIFDLLLFTVCIVAFIKYTIDWIKIKCLKRENVDIAPRRHMILLLNLFAHTCTVVFSFFTCTVWIPHIIVICIGTALMNPLGTCYFVYQLVDKPISYKALRILGNDFDISACTNCFSTMQNKIAQAIPERPGSNEEDEEDVKNASSVIAKAYRFPSIVFGKAKRNIKKNTVTTTAKNTNNNNKIATTAAAATTTTTTATLNNKINVSTSNAITDDTIANKMALSSANAVNNGNKSNNQNSISNVNATRNTTKKSSNATSSAKNNNTASASNDTRKDNVTAMTRQLNDTRQSNNATQGIDITHQVKIQGKKTGNKDNEFVTINLND
jgi:hypothetical protein